MDRLDKELREALRREDPPEGFAARVLARAAQSPPRFGLTAWLRVPAMRWALAAGLCLLVAAGVAVERRRAATEQARGEAAKGQLMLALRITGSKLQLARAKVVGRGPHHDAPRLERPL